MKKNRTFILLSILILTLLVGILIPMIVEAKDPLPSPSATGHLIWDAIDKVWRCVGSPIDCA